MKIPCKHLKANNLSCIGDCGDHTCKLNKGGDNEKAIRSMRELREQEVCSMQMSEAGS